MLKNGNFNVRWTQKHLISAVFPDQEVTRLEQDGLSDVNQVVLIQGLLESISSHFVSSMSQQEVCHQLTCP